MSRIDSTTFILNRHDFDTTFTAIYNSNTPAAGVAIITPTTNNKLQIVGVQVDTAATSGSVVFKLATSNNTVAKFYTSTTSGTEFVSSVTIKGALNEALTMVSTLGTSEFTVTVLYKQF